MFGNSRIRAGVINLCSENELFRISSILAQCKAAVTCDSGLMHLSALLKLRYWLYLVLQSGNLDLLPTKTKV
ncbi:MAG: hypothetical protein IPG53_06305 [Ignavibacteriales bacterium]|nr:hypothetical protein [Ignavibacteriales bacterium]